MPDWYEKTAIGALVDRAAHRFGSKEALYFEGKRWTFAQIKEDVDRAAKGLISLGIQPGEKLALWMPNRPEWVHLLFAVAKVGAELVPSTPVSAPPTWNTWSANPTLPRLLR